MNTYYSNILIVVLCVFLAFAVLYTGVLVLVGKYVIQDARKRGMNHKLWLAISILMPYYSGFFLYLIMRPSRLEYSQNICPNCKYVLEENYKFCPSCGTEIVEEQKAKNNIDKELRTILFCIVGLTFIVVATIIISIIMVLTNDELYRILKMLDTVIYPMTF